MKKMNYFHILHVKNTTIRWIKIAILRISAKLSKYPFIFHFFEEQANILKTGFVNRSM